MASEGGALLDVNALVALAWPNHVGYEAARKWFMSAAADGWATTPVTESGFVRISSNRKAMPLATTPEIAGSMLEQLTQHGVHDFWPDAVRTVTGDAFGLSALRGYRQVTDAHLLALAAQNGGRLVTFDTGLKSLGDHVGVDVELLG